MEVLLVSNIKSVQCESFGNVADMSGRVGQGAEPCRFLSTSLQSSFLEPTVLKAHPCKKLSPVNGTTISDFVSINGQLMTQIDNGRRKSKTSF